MLLNPRTAEDGAAVIPSDSTELNFYALYVGGSGNVVIKSMKGNIVTYQDVPAGTQLQAAGVRVMAATTATKITTMC